MGDGGVVGHGGPHDGNVAVVLVLRDPCDGQLGRGQLDGVSHDRTEVFRHALAEHRFPGARMRRPVDDLEVGGQDGAGLKPEHGHAGRTRVGAGLGPCLTQTDPLHSGVADSVLPALELVAGDLGLGERGLAGAVGRSAEDELLGVQAFQGRGVLVAQSLGQAGEQDQQEGDQGHDSTDEGEPPSGKGDVADGQVHGEAPVRADSGGMACFPASRERARAGSPRRPMCGH